MVPTFTNIERDSTNEFHQQKPMQELQLLQWDSPKLDWGGVRRNPRTAWEQERRGHSVWQDEMLLLMKHSEEHNVEFHSFWCLSSQVLVYCSSNWPLQCTVKSLQTVRDSQTISSITGIKPSIIKIRYKIALQLLTWTKPAISHLSKPSKWLNGHFYTE